MKELLIKEKAKRYDEALEKARQLCAYPTTKPFISDLQDLFPELKESEDEKIRKEIISFLKEGKPYHCPNSAKRQEWAAWLEKQSNKDEEILVLKDQIESLHAAIKALKEAHKIELEKQAWKQENTVALTDFENAMMHIGDSFFGQHAGLDPNDTNAIKEQANLLLELVPKQEWREEDKKKISELKIFIAQCNGFNKVNRQKAFNLIDSLSPHNTWKPSEEQIMVLAKASETYCGIDKGVLYSLYNDLKKLREE